MRVRLRTAVAAVAGVTLTAVAIPAASAGSGGQDGRGGPSRHTDYRRAADPTFELIGSYRTGLADPAGGATSGEVAHFADGRLYVTNATDASVDIVDARNPAAPRLLHRIDLSAYGETVTSVAAGRNQIAAAVESDTEPGKVVLFTPDGRDLRAVAVGAGPDMVTFTPDGRRILVANEGEPSGYEPGDVDPAGSVSVIDLTPRQPKVTTIGFQDFDPGARRAKELPAGVRVFGSSLPSLDLEPEYVTVSADGHTAWVSLQENNAIAVLDLKRLTVSRINALGFKDLSAPGNGIDASDRDGGINIRTWPNILGMYQPDALAAFSVRGRSYVLSANEGDAREYDGLVEAARLRSTTTDASFGPDRADTAAGRLNVTTATPGQPSGQSKAYAFGTRSFTVWDGSTGTLVADSGDQLEQTIAAALPANFNSNNDENTFDNRSDDKGPEPEAVAVGEINGRTFGFVGMERVGGFAVVDLSNPKDPEIVQYLNNRDFTLTDTVGPDSGPEVIDFVDARNSPTHRPLVIVSNEITGTVSLYGLAGSR